MLGAKVQKVCDNTKRKTICCVTFSFFAYYINKKVVTLRHDCRDAAYSMVKRQVVIIMKENFYIQLFEGKQVRIVWDAEKEKYYFAVADIVEIVTESKDAKQYIKRMRARDPELNSRWGTICTPTRMIAADGKPYMTNASDLEGIFRI